MSTALTYLIHPPSPQPHHQSQCAGAASALYGATGPQAWKWRALASVLVVAAREIILTAGAIVSPQLLMLSGVGPAEHLQQMGLPVVHVLPGVGQNLRDHPNIRVPVQVKDDFPLDPKAPRTQLALRYTAVGSSDRNDLQIMQSFLFSPIGGDPLQAEVFVDLHPGAGRRCRGAASHLTDPNRAAAPGLPLSGGPLGPATLA